ncbi:MAG: hypothetical protein ABI945_07440 [Nitrospirales bacterium]
MTAIKGYSNNLLAGVVGSLPDKAISYLTRIEHNADRLTLSDSPLLSVSWPACAYLGRDFILTKQVAGPFIQVR